MSQIFEALQQSQATKSVEAASLLDFSALTSAAPEIEAPSLEEVPALRLVATPERRLVALSEGRNLGAEKFRMLATRLRQLQARKPVKKILVSSAVQEEGKSFVSSNLALALGKLQQRVLLIDGDCHQTALEQLFGARGLEGLGDWWQSARPVLGYLCRIEGLPVWFLPAGAELKQPLEMLQSPRMAELLNEIASWFDWVIIDSPPVAPLADAAVWATLTDGTLLVVRKGRTPKKMLTKLLNSCDKPKLLGVVLNDSLDPHAAYYKQYYSKHPAAQPRIVPTPGD